MTEDTFDFFGELLFDEAKFLFEKAHESKYKKEKQLYLHASLLVGISALEAYINAVCQEVVETEEYGIDLYGKSLLYEKKIELDKGCAKLGKQLQMTRLTDRIEYLYNRFSKRKICDSDTWRVAIHQAITLRNELVHPKQVLSLTEKQVETALQSVLDTIDAVFMVVYSTHLPILNYGLQSVKHYNE